MIPFVILAIEDENDRAFMADLYDKYHRLMLSEIRKLVGPNGDPEDVLQTTLVKLIDKLSLLRTLEERALANYVVTAAQNNARSELRRRKRLVFSLDDDGWAEGARLAQDSVVEDALRRGEIVELLEEIWPRLDERTRFFLEARYFLDMSFEEMAKELDILPDSARMGLSRARGRAREFMSERYAAIKE